jgi:hypothetical protein
MAFAGPFPFPKQEVRHRILTTGTTAFGDDEMIPAGRLVQLHARTADCYFRLHPEYLVDGDFESPLTWDLLAGVGDAEGAQISKTNSAKVGPRGWMVSGDRTKILLNKTAPLHGSRDAKLTLSAASDILFQTTRRPLLAGATDLVFTHKESNVGGGIEYAITRITSAGVLEYLQGGGTWDVAAAWTAVASTSAVKVTRNFTAAALHHQVLFRPNGALLVEFSQIDNVFFSTLADVATEEPLKIDVHKMITVQEPSRLSFDAGGAGTVAVVEYEV